MRIMFIIDNDTAEISEIGKKSHARADDKRCIPVPCLNPCVKEFFLREFAGYKDRVVCIQFCVPEMGERKLGNQKKRLFSRADAYIDRSRIVIAPIAFCGKDRVARI